MLDLSNQNLADYDRLLDVSRESPATHRLYGLDNEATRDYGTRCLIARRLVERGVRFVQVFTRNQFWDHHGAIASALPTAEAGLEGGNPRQRLIRVVGLGDTPEVVALSAALPSPPA